MALLSKEFKNALSAIEPGVDAEHARDAHAEVRDVLDMDDELRGWGLKTLLIGSYAREVSIRRVKDVDVFCELPELPDGYGPQDLLGKMAAVLADEYGDRVAENDRSVKVEFPEFDMHVDIVPARSCGNAWEIPNRDGGWEKTDPVEFGSLSSTRNADFDQNYVPVVKLARQTRRALLGEESKPGGLFVEVAAYHAFANLPLATGDDALGSTAEYYTRALAQMAPLIRGHADGSERLTNPALPDQELEVRATQDEFDALADKWEEAAMTAEEAFESEDDHDAAEGFKSLLGENSDGDEVFPVPAVPSEAAAAATDALRTPGRKSLPSGDSPTFG
ncbi:nucleotidyltransferase [Kribbella sp. NBC_01245]|uniref:nucleotidyltransferase n=1 Tax=Kribbella sp. NBC_01245 TaxID=2903578 RepID=UPI002E2B2C5E|nr:nucleotidyltransferase [Kribbella sp. NBC_01245]